VASDSNIGRRRAAARAEGRAGYEERRLEVLRTAAGVFKQRGFQGTTLNHIAEALNTDRASLYYYVGSKEELFQEIVSEAMRVNVETAVQIRDAGGRAPEILRRLIEALMVSYGEYYPVLYVLIQENLNHVAPERSGWAKEMRNINQEYEQLMIGVVEAGQRDGTLRDTAPAWLIAYGIIGMVGWTNRWFNPNRAKAGAAEIGGAFADMLLDGLVVPQSRPATRSAPKPKPKPTAKRPAPRKTPAPRTRRA
jgi:TetR/AcrR family transcriptional regulator, cholesterol catabolism regulator